MTKFIALAGPPSSGKTSLARALTNYYKEQGIKAYAISEYARSFIEEYGREPLKNPLIQYKLFQEQILLEAQVPQEVELAFADSPVYLGYIFTLMRLGFQNLGSNLEMFIAVNDAYKTVLKTATHYAAHILLLPKDIIYDGIRTETQEDVEDIYKRTRGFLDLHGIDFFGIGSHSDIEERVGLVHRYLKELGVV